MQRIVPLLRGSSGPLPAVAEIELLRSAEGYLQRRFGFRSISVVREAESEAVDPRGRRERARPGAPAFYLVPAAGA